ncbi:MAG TPA: AtpZ/AtpI family protein [Chitinophagales bacterium]|nr:AtpZ/AtpI family protein [Chitinophagales bacterium]
MEQQQPPRKQPAKSINNWIAYSGMAFEMFAIIGLFAAGGYYLDKKLGIAPVLLILFLLLGLSVAFYRIYKQFSQK